MKCGSLSKLVGEGNRPKRPTATQVVGQLEALTDRPDPRTLGNINVSPQDILYPETNFFYPPTSRSSAYNSNTSLPWNLRRSPRGPNLNGDPFSTLTTTEYDEQDGGIAMSHVHATEQTKC